MLIPTSAFYEPSSNHGVALVAVPVSLFVFAYSTDFGQLPILVFYACWLPLLLARPSVLMRAEHRVLPLLALPMLAVASSFWSDQAAATLRGALQYSSTIVCGLVAARLVVPEALAKGGLLGTLLVLAYSFAYGHYVYDVVDGSYSFAGAFGSKNQLGLYASLGVVFAVACLFWFRVNWFWKSVAVGAGGWSLLAIALADSATSTLTIAGGLLFSLFARVLFAVEVSVRRAMLAGSAALVSALAAQAYAAGAFRHLFAAFGKDATLTGRTYLWREGLEIGGENWAFGLGYNAFWVHGRPMAEQLWEQFYIASRTGFHFHSTFIEAYVALGVAGVALAVALVAALLVLAARVLLGHRATGPALLLTSLALIFVARSTVEVDMLTPYTVGSFLTAYLLLSMADQCAPAAVGAGVAQPPPPTADPPAGAPAKQEAVLRLRPAWIVPRQRPQRAER